MKEKFKQLSKLECLKLVEKIIEKRHFYKTSFILNFIINLILFFRISNYIRNINSESFQLSNTLTIFNIILIVILALFYLYRGIKLDLIDEFNLIRVIRFIRTKKLENYKVENVLKKWYNKVKKSPNWYTIKRIYLIALFMFFYFIILLFFITFSFFNPILLSFIVNFGFIFIIINFVVSLIFFYFSILEMYRNNACEILDKVSNPYLKLLSCRLQRIHNSITYQKKHVYENKVIRIINLIDDILNFKIYGSLSKAYRDKFSVLDKDILLELKKDIISLEVLVKNTEFKFKNDKYIEFLKIIKERINFEIDYFKELFKSSINKTIYLYISIVAAIVSTSYYVFRMFS